MINCKCEGTSAFSIAFGFILLCLFFGFLSRWQFNQEKDNIPKDLITSNTPISDRINRVENKEVICYIRYGVIMHSMQCKFKEKQ